MIVFGRKVGVTLEMNLSKCRLNHVNILQIFNVLEVNTQFYHRGVCNVYSVNILITHTKVIKLCIH